MAIFVFILFSWPFLLVIAPPKVYRDDTPCCSGCGHINHDIRVVEYKIGIALFGLIPIYGVYKRPLCKVCRNFLYRIAIIFENLFSLIWVPIGTVLGIIWIFKNQSSKRININDTIEILSNIQIQCKKHNVEIEAQKIQEVINKFKIKFAKQTKVDENIIQKSSDNNIGVKNEQTIK